MASATASNAFWLHLCQLEFCTINTQLWELRLPFVIQISNILFWIRSIWWICQDKADWNSKQQNLVLFSVKKNSRRVMILISCSLKTLIISLFQKRQTHECPPNVGIMYMIFVLINLLFDEFIAILFVFCFQVTSRKRNWIG